MSKVRSVFVGVALVAGSLAGMASAVTMHATYRGTVSAGIDQSNVFGAGSSLDGLAFRLRFTYDPDTPGALRTTDAFVDTVAGGVASGFASPMRSAKLTINEHTLNFDTGFASLAESADTDTINQIRHDVSSFVVGDKEGRLNAVNALVTSNSSLFSANLESLIPLTSVGVDPFGGAGFQYIDCALNHGGCLETSGDLAPSSVQVAPIPLPGALPLLASGLAGLGFVAFRHRRIGQPAAA